MTPEESIIVLKKQRKILLASLGVGAFALLVAGFYVLGESEKSRPEKKKTASDREIAIETMSLPTKSIDEREMWVKRVESESEKIRQESKEIREQNSLLQGRIDVLDSLFKTAPGQQYENKNQMQQNEQKIDKSGAGGPSTNEVKGDVFPPVDQPLPPQSSPQPMPPPVSSSPQSFSSNANLSVSTGSKILHVGTTGGVARSSRHKDMYLPAGSYARSVLLSGVVAATATSAQGAPQPIMLRIIDDGNLPRGFTSRVKDAVVIGACYGDISSERVLCRLETMSWVEPNGLTVERKVEGWVFGEDGRQGLRGSVVDRSSDVAREALFAGMLSSLSSFFQAEAQRSVFPISPFGQTNGLSTGRALTGAAGSGVGNAMDRLADFSIKRAEQMQPVIQISSGRVVDIAFKTGVDLSPGGASLVSSSTSIQESKQ